MPSIPHKVSSPNITSLKPNQVFVFGSNLAGRHGAGAAKTALHKFGAIMGQGKGLQGQSYAIATKDHSIRTLPAFKIYLEVLDFLKFAIKHSELEFLVTEVGCGLAGFTPAEIAPFFKGAPANVALPQSFWNILDKDKSK